MMCFTASVSWDQETFQSTLVLALLLSCERAACGKRGFAKMSASMYMAMSSSVSPGRSCMMLSSCRARETRLYGLGRVGPLNRNL